MLVVIDTNVLVSSLWSRCGSSAKVVGMVVSGALLPCYDHHILCEYREVLRCPKFTFSQGQINALLGRIESNGQSVVADHLDAAFIDESDRKIYEVAKYCNATLLTGNLKHFPKDPLVMNVTDFLEGNESQ